MSEQNDSFGNDKSEDVRVQQRSLYRDEFMKYVSERELQRTERTDE